MGVDYDTWLQQPYQDNCDAQDAYDEAEESFRGSDTYWEHYEEWLKTNEGMSETDWEETNDYVSSVESHLRSINEPPTEEDYYGPY
jgi:hypothetical protein